jgi:hypothetical protein
MLIGKAGNRKESKAENKKREKGGIYYDKDYFGH